MIADRLVRWPRYFSSAVWRTVFEYLLQLEPDAPEGTFELQGRDVYARVMSYETKHESSAILESHVEYIDIQAGLEGPERIAWFTLEGLSPLGPYDPVKDVTHYEHPPSPAGQVTIERGSFVVLFPTDAHMPQLAAGHPQRIKKAVVKVRVTAVR